MTEPAGAAIPAHVPPGLVYDFDYYAAPADTTFPQIDIARRLRAEAPDIFFTPRNGGHWMVTRYEDGLEISRLANDFSNDPQFNIDRQVKPRMVPIEYDPPEHTDLRRVLKPVFTPAAVRRMADGIRALAIELIDQVLRSGGCEFVTEIARRFPITIFLRLLGLPIEEMPQFMEWGHWFLHHDSTDEKRGAAITAIAVYLSQKLEERRLDPKDDLMNFALHATVDGRPWTPQETLGFCVFFFVAGLDTVASALGFIFRELAQRPDLQQRLRDEPAIVDDAVEEFVRAFGVVVTSRRVIKECQFHGVTMKEGDLVSLPTGVASRDPTEFPDPHRIDFNRTNTRNLSFAAGPHRCIGSHLARRELKIALQEWLKRAENIRLVPGKAPVTHGSVVFGFETLPIAWDPT